MYIQFNKNETLFLMYSGSSLFGFYFYIRALPLKKEVTGRFGLLQRGQNFPNENATAMLTDLAHSTDADIGKQSGA